MLKKVVQEGIASGSLKPELIGDVEELDRSYDCVGGNHDEMMQDIFAGYLEQNQALQPNRSPPHHATRLSLTLHQTKRSQSPYNETKTMNGVGNSQLEEIQKTLNQLKSNIDNQSDKSNGGLGNSSTSLIKHAQEVALLKQKVTMLEDYNLKLTDSQSLHKQSYQKLNSDYVSLTKKYKDLKEKHVTVKEAKDGAEARISVLTQEISKLRESKETARKSNLMQEVDLNQSLFEEMRNNYEQS